MKTEIINITPEIAASFLQFNADNRPLRKNVVASLKAAFQRGEYTPSHQGVAFNEAGILIDGQHRLTAISEMRDGSFPMLVTRGLSEEAFKNIDGGVKRTAADALKEDRKLVEVASLFCKLSGNGRTKAGLTPASLVPFIEEIAYHHGELMSAYAGTIKTWTSAPVRAAAILSIRKGIDLDYVKSVYRVLATRDLDAMQPVARSLFKSEASGTAKASYAIDMLARCLAVFDPKKAQNRHIAVHGSLATVSLVRDTFRDIIAAQSQLLLDAEKKAAPLSAAKGISRANYLIAAR